MLAHPSLGRSLADVSLQPIYAARPCSAPPRPALRCPALPCPALTPPQPRPGEPVDIHPCSLIRRAVTRRGRGRERGGWRQQRGALQDALNEIIFERVKGETKTKIKSSPPQPTKMYGYEGPLSKLNYHKWLFQYKCGYISSHVILGPHIALWQPRKQRT